MAQFAFELVAPEKRLFSAEVDSVIVPGTEGEFTVLAEHAPFMTTLRPGAVTVKNGSQSEHFMVFAGFAEANPDGLIILAERALNLKDVDRAQLDQDISDLTDDVRDAKDEKARAAYQARLDELLALKAELQRH